MTQSSSTISGNPTSSSPPPPQQTPPIFHEAKDRWQCQVCRSVRVSERAVFSVIHAGTIQRIICEGCGTVGHYDTPLGDGVAPTATHNRKFLIVDSFFHGIPDAPRSTAMLTSSTP